MNRSPYRSAWLMLMTLTCAFALSQAFRTVAGIMAPPLQKDFGLTPQQLGLFAGAFHFAFGALQLFMGVGIDLKGVRRTVLFAWPLAIVGAVLSALAPNFTVLVIGQVLIGAGSAPAFLVCTVFIARQFPPERFAQVSGLILGVGSAGMLLTGTPLAWVIEHQSWRRAFLLLAAASLLAWIGIWAMVRDPSPAPGAAPSAPRPTVLSAIRGYGALFRLPHTLGIVALASVSYASFISLRGLWIGPLLIERHGFSLVQSGNVAVVATAVGMVAAPLFGRFDPGNARRRRWITAFTLSVAAVFTVMAFNPGASLDVIGSVLVGVLSGYIVFEYADTRVAYPASMTGRAMAVFTMAMFLGVALMQWITGAVATAATAHGVDPYQAVLLTIGAMLLLGAAAFRWLPAPPMPPPAAT